MVSKNTGGSTEATVSSSSSSVVSSVVSITEAGSLGTVELVAVSGSSMSSGIESPGSMVGKSSTSI